MKAPSTVEGIKNEGCNGYIRSVGRDCDLGVLHQQHVFFFLAVRTSKAKSHLDVITSLGFHFLHI